MKILCPISNLTEINLLIQEGVDEFYFGINLLKKINDFTSLNARPFKGMNLQSVKEAQTIINTALKHNKKIFLCWNNKFYSAEQYNLIRKILENLKGLSGVFVVDIPLIRLIKKDFPRLEVVVSTIAHILNWRAVQFYRRLGAERVTLSRNLYFPDILKIMKQYKTYKFDIFIKNEDCLHINGLCNYTHNIWDSQEISFCRVKERSVSFVKYQPGRENIKKHLKQYQEKLTNRICGACYLYYLNKLPGPGRISLKFAGREHNLKQKLKDIRFIKESLNLLSLKLTEASYQKQVKKLFEEIYGFKCQHRCSYATEG